jgi:hypothetical protein
MGPGLGLVSVRDGELSGLMGKQNGLSSFASI